MKGLTYNDETVPANSVMGGNLAIPNRNQKNDDAVLAVSCHVLIPQQGGETSCWNVLKEPNYFLMQK